MKILDYKVFDGRNIYSHKKCIKLVVDLEGYKDIPSKAIAGFNYNLINILPELQEHRCGIDEEGGFVKRLKEGTYLAHICEHIIIAIQNQLGLDVYYGKAREIKDDLYYIIVQYHYEKAALASANLAIDLVNGLVENKPIDFQGRLDIIRAILDEEILGPTTEAICNAARTRGIPVMPLGRSGIFQLGYGKAGKIVEASITSNTSCIASDVSCDKLLTKQLLREQWLPVAEGDKAINSLDLIKVIEQIGYPVVLKPQYGSKGNGVKVNIKNEKELMHEYSSLKQRFEDIIVEKYYQGNDYRVCMVDYKVVAVALRIPPFVVGDGRRSVKELIGEINSDKLRGEDHEKPLTKIKIDNSLMLAINKKGYNIDSIPKEGEKLILRENANLSTGGISIDCTDIICKENIDICIRAAKTIGLDVCGIDICCRDISMPLDKQNGIILEVNAAPGLRMHHYPAFGEKRDVAGAVVDMLFKDSPTSIPVISVSGTNGKTTTTRLISHTLSLMGYKVGMTSTGGIFVGEEKIAKGDTTGPQSAKAILQNKDVAVAVLETARGGIIRDGLGYDLADVGVITNITDDHLGIDGINTMEDLAYIKALVVEAVKETGYAVLNADDYWSMSIIGRIKCNKILFSSKRENPYILQNLSEGGYGIYIDKDEIVVEKEDRIYKICKINQMPLCLQGALLYNAENAMAACGALIGASVDYCMITKGLTTFKGDEEGNPGRFNVYNYNGYKLILDYGHNIEGYKAVLKSARSLQHNRLVGIIGVPGDRMDESIYQVGKISGEFLDYIYIKEDMEKRGRKKGEIAKLLLKGVKLNKAKSKKCEIILDEVEALKKALDMANSGDLIVMFFEDYDRVKSFLKSKEAVIVKEVIV